MSRDDMEIEVAKVEPYIGAKKRPISTHPGCDDAVLVQTQDNDVEGPMSDTPGERRFVRGYDDPVADADVWGSMRISIARHAVHARPTPPFRTKPDDGSTHAGCPVSRGSDDG